MKRVLSPLTYLFSLWSVGAFTTISTFSATAARRTTRRCTIQQRHPLTQHKTNDGELFDLSATVSLLDFEQDKTDEEILFIIETILKSSRVSNVDISDSNLLELVEACERKLATRDDDIFMHGENEYIYLIKEGTCLSFLEGKQNGEIKAGHLFGKASFFHRIATLGFF